MEVPPIPASLMSEHPAIDYFAFAIRHEALFRSVKLQKIQRSKIEPWARGASRECQISLLGFNGSNLGVQKTDVAFSCSAPRQPGCFAMLTATCRLLRALQPIPHRCHRGRNNTTRKKAHVIRIDIAARLILQAYELGLEGKLHGLTFANGLLPLWMWISRKLPPSSRRSRERKEGLRSRPLRPPRLKSVHARPAPSKES
jgi:hypothetical protein